MPPHPSTTPPPNTTSINKGQLLHLLFTRSTYKQQSELEKYVIKPCKSCYENHCSASALPQSTPFQLYQGSTLCPLIREQVRGLQQTYKQQSEFEQQTMLSKHVNISLYRDNCSGDATAPLHTPCVDFYTCISSC